jgi:hypothetical protein
MIQKFTAAGVQQRDGFNRFITVRRVPLLSVTASGQAAKGLSRVSKKSAQR